MLQADPTPGEAIMAQIQVAAIMARLTPFAAAPSVMGQKTFLPPY